MKKIIYLALALCLAAACKKEAAKEYPENPDWLTEMISGMETPPLYAGTTIYAYEWAHDYYYHIQIPLASCAMCEFYNYRGVKFEWTADKYADFQKNAKMLKIVWHRDTI
jgi:hypothetical protein